MWKIPSGKELASFRSKLRSGGRIQVPKEVRESESLKDGEFVDVKVYRVKTEER